MCTLNYELCFQKNGFIYVLLEEMLQCWIWHRIILSLMLFRLNGLLLALSPACPAILYLFSYSTLKYKVYEVFEGIMFFVVVFFGRILVGLICSFSFMGFLPPWCLARVICRGQNMPPPPLAGTTYQNKIPTL